MHITLFKRALLELPSNQIKIPTCQCWRQPDLGWIMINTEGGGGGVGRSHISFPIRGVTDPLITEVLALREGVVFVQLRGFLHVVMEMDCLETVNLWSARRNSRWIVTPILDEIVERSPCFASFSVRHARRDANNSAYLCAKFACTLMVCDCWFSESLDFLVNSILADCNRLAINQ